MKTSKVYKFTTYAKLPFEPAAVCGRSAGPFLFSARYARSKNNKVLRKPCEFYPSSESAARGRIEKLQTDNFRPRSNNKFLIATAATLAIVFSPAAAMADDASELLDFVKGIYNTFLLPIGCVLAGIMIIYGGISYAASAGEPTKVQKAKEYIFGAISGLVLLLTAAQIVKIILS